MVLAAESADVKEKVAVQSMIKRHHLALEDVVNLEDLGVSWAALEDPMILQPAKDAMIRC